MDEGKKSKKSNISIIMISLGLFLICFGIIFSLTNSSKVDNNTDNNTEENTENNNSENNNTENNTENNNGENDNTNNINDDDIENDNQNDGERKEVEITDEIMSLYLKYHSSDYPVELSENVIESKIYDVDVFNISNINNFLPVNYGIKIVEGSINDTNLNSSNISDENEYNKLLFENLEKHFNEFFGKKVKYNKDLFKCYDFELQNGIMKYTNNCSTTSSKSAQYNAIKAEKDNNNIYIYEDVVIKENSTVITDYVYRWVYRIQNDKNYYLLRVERVKYQSTSILEKAEDIKTKYSLINFNNNLLYKSDKYDINSITFEELIVTALSKMQICKDDKSKNISIESLNNQLKYYIKKELTIDDIKKHANNGKLTVLIDNYPNYEYNITINKDNTLTVSNPKCNSNNIVKEFVRTHIINTENKDNTITIYEKVAFGRYNENQKDDNGSYKVDYYYDYDKSDKVLETLSLTDSKEPNWELYKTYKYTFELKDGIYYFQSMEIVK